MHPQLAHDRHQELPLFEGLLPETRYVGEVGLDGTPGYRRHADVQRRVFETVLRMSARSGGRILSIHSRRAGDEVLECLRLAPDAGVPILHWFSGSKAQVRRAIDQGCWFSVGPPMATSANGRAILEMLPHDRVLTETDGPFAEHDGRPLRPGDTADMARALGAAWKVPSSEVPTQLMANLRRLGAEGATSEAGRTS